MAYQESTPNNDNSVVFQRNYDKELQHEIELGFANLIRAITGYCIETGSTMIFEPQAVAQINSKLTQLLQWCKQLYIKYHEIYLKEKDEKGERKTSIGWQLIEKIENNVGTTFILEGPVLNADLKTLQNQEIYDIAVKHKLMDKTNEKEPWEREVKGKFFLNQLPPEIWEPHEKYLNSISREWKKNIFLETAHMVLGKGDIIKLIVGPNATGKTWTDIAETRYATWTLRNYWAKLPLSYYEGIPNLDGAEIWEALQKVKPYSLSRNLSFYPDPEAIRQMVATGSRFQVLGITEGMKAAINLRSWDPEVIDMILEIFTERASNNYISFEYQLASRPPKMLQGRFNVYEAKFGPRWIVLSMPSSFYRGEDPLYTRELEKMKGDRRISKWFVNKSQNTNYITKLKAPRISQRTERKFKQLRALSKEEYEKGRVAKKALGNIWYAKIAEYYDKTLDGEIAYIDIPTILREKNQFNEKQVKKFMQDYEKFERDYKLLHPMEEK